MDDGRDHRQDAQKDIKFELINADVIDRRTGRPTAATIAFSLAYEGHNPAVVQQVANVLTSLYLEENLRVREQQTEGAMKFMEDERKSVEEQMAEIDKQIAAFKQKNVNTLPEFSQYNLQGIDRLERDIDQLNDQLKTLREKENYLQSQLASVPIDSSNPDKDRLRELRVKLVNLESRFTDEYPDVKKTKAEIADLEKKLKTTGQNPIDNKPDNPAYVTLSAQLASTRSEIESVRRQINASPGETQRLRSPDRDVGPGRGRLPGADEPSATACRPSIDDLSKKYMESKTASGLEKGQMGERFTLIDAARLPEKPVRPNIPAILLIGLVLGIGAGVGSAALKEFSDQSVRTAGALSSALGLPVLAVVPEILTKEDTVEDKQQRKEILIGVAVVVVVAILIFHFFVMDLDILWAKFMRRMVIKKQFVSFTL